MERSGTDCRANTNRSLDGGRTGRDFDANMRNKVDGSNRDINGNNRAAGRSDSPYDTANHNKHGKSNADPSAQKRRNDLDDDYNRRSRTNDLDGNRRDGHDGSDGNRNNQDGKRRGDDGTCPLRRGNCFVAGTMVKMPDGEQAIETLRVGQRVTTGSGDDRDADIPDIQPDVPDTPIEPDTWRVVQLSLKTEEGEYLTVELLRPLDWLAEHGAEPGAVIQLDLPELGASGPAEVVDILPCPELESGPGRVVTATFHHASGDIYDLRITIPNPDGTSEPITETIGVTGRHPFWSDTRRAWVPARSLRPGERLRTLDGSAEVVSTTFSDHNAPVFNIEVDVDHVYRVGETGVLVHNASNSGCPSGTKFTKTETPWKRKVYQRDDIDWDLVRPEGTRLAGQPNWQAAEQGFAPGRINPRTGKWDDVVLHHSVDDPRGEVIEAFRSSHTKYHQKISRSPNTFNELPGDVPWRQQRPDWSTAWQKEQSAYWRWRTGMHNPKPTPKLLLPGDT